MIGGWNPRRGRGSEGAGLHVPAATVRAPRRGPVGVSKASGHREVARVFEIPSPGLRRRSCCACGLVRDVGLHARQKKKEKKKEN